MPTPARRLYPHWLQNCPLDDYRPIIGHLGDAIAIACSEELQGIAFVAYAGEEGTVGILHFRFGCCPGCDRLSDCRTYAEVDALIIQMASSIQWMPRSSIRLWGLGLGLLGNERAVWGDLVEQLGNARQTV